MMIHRLVAMRCAEYQTAECMRLELIAARVSCRAPERVTNEDCQLAVRALNWAQLRTRQRSLRCKCHNGQI